MENRELRSGFTTGTCAAVAAKAAAALLITGETCDEAGIVTPSGEKATMKICSCSLEGDRAVCAVRKDAGDDPDVTHGALIFASAEYIDKNDASTERCYCSEREPGIYLTGGAGIGTVTKKGLACPVGMKAINPVPRSMIFKAVEEAREKEGLWDPLLITIWIPCGEELALRTFNPKLGIQGGLSVLGTTGIVEPMSEKALMDTIRLEIHMKAAQGADSLILTPGNYGRDFLRNQLQLSLDQAVKCGNFLRDSLEAAAGEGINHVLLVGHIGKLIKVAGGVGNTHSRYGDRRMEIFWDCASAVLGKTSGWGGLERAILESNTTEEAVCKLKSVSCLEMVMEEVTGRIYKQTKRWTGPKSESEVVTFSSQYGILGMSAGAQKLARHFTGGGKGSV